MSAAGKRRKQPAPKPSRKPARVAERMPPPEWLKTVTLALTAVCLLGLFATEIADTDFWWHLKTGQYILQHHSLPLPDPFAYTTPHTPLARFNLTHEWLSQALMYLVYAVAGFGGIVLARAALLAGICGIAGWLAARLSASFYAGIAAACATASVLTVFSADRPGVVSFLGVAVFVCLLELRRGWWTLPAIALVWANSHGGFFLGWIVLAAYCLEYRQPRLWLIAACSVAASMLNPNGLRVVATILDYRRSPMTASLIEWRPPSLWGSPYAFDVLLYAAALALLLSWRRVRLAHWILFAVFAAASLAAFRNTPLIAFLAPVLIAAYFPLRVRVPAMLAWTPPILALLAIPVGLELGRPQFRVADWTIPAGAADYLLAHPPAGRIFNTYEQGGYLIWRLAPAERVFIDGRSLSESAYRDYQQILVNAGSISDQVTGPRADLLDRYGVQTVVMNTMDYVSGAMYPLALALANPVGTDWQMVYEDAQAVIFERHPPPGAAVLPNKLGRVLAHMDRECEAYIANAPDYPLCARTLARYWRQNQVPDEARRLLLLYLSHAPRRDEEAESWLH